MCLLDWSTVQKIYRDYKVSSLMAFTPRSGFARCGIYSFTGDSYDPDRPESVAEHSYSVARLAKAVSVFCPGFLPRRNLAEALEIALFHDAAEVFTGDIPDDGRRSEEEKKAKERAVLQDDVLQNWPSAARRQLMREIDGLQEQTQSIGQLMYCLDKVEAPLKALQYEAGGCYGTSDNHPDTSELDKYYAGIAGGPNIADSWSIHVLDRTFGLIYFDLVYQLLTVAFEDVRGIGGVPDSFTRHYRMLKDKT